MHVFLLYIWTNHHLICMETFKSLLQELDATLRQYNMPAYENLLPPLPDTEIDKNLQELGIDDEDLKALFQWKSGMGDENGPLMMNFGGLITFGSIKESIDFNEYFDPLLIPLISDNGEEMLLFNSKPGPHYGKLYLFSIAMLLIEHPMGYYDSLTAMVKTTIQAYKENIYKYEKGSNMVDIDFDKFFTIAKINNPNSIYWTEPDPHNEEEWYEI